MRFYRVDILDYYRGTLTSRRLGVLIAHLPHDAALVRALNDGRPGWSQTDHLLADVWALLLRVNSERDDTPDHPLRELMVEKARAAQKKAHLGELRARFDRLKNRYRRSE